MASTGNMDLVSMDFDAYKASLRTYLKSQAVFKDYDFEGSNINVLLDILSYNSFKNSFYLNMALSEGFIDSAQLLNSVRSHAKELNYLPRSATSAVAKVLVSFNATGENEPYIIQKGQSFSSVVKNGSFIFSIPDTITATKLTSGSYIFATGVYEGTYFKDTYLFNADEYDPQPKFSISNANVDTTSIVVSVYEDGSALGDSYKMTQSLLDVDSLSKIFFIQPSAITGNYEILFGDNILGRRPKQGSTIVIDYRVTNGNAGNGASLFNINFDPTGVYQESSNIEVTTLSNAVDGALMEDIETTRFYAPRYFQTQERAVVTTDYETLLKQKFPEINAITAYGGEQLSPPQFGKVVIAMNLTNIQGLPMSRQLAYYNFIVGRCPLTVRPVFIPSENTYIGISSQIRYNINVTNESPDRIKTLVLASIENFNQQNLNDFNSTFRFSRFTTELDNADDSIISNSTSVSLYKKLQIIPQQRQSFSLAFSTPLKNDLSVVESTHPLNTDRVLTSSYFFYNGSSCILEDNGIGTVRVTTIQGSNYVAVNDVGTINYNTGQVILNNFAVDSFYGDALIIYVTPRDNDITSSQNVFLSIEPSQSSINIQSISS